MGKGHKKDDNRRLQKVFKYMNFIKKIYDKDRNIVGELEINEDGTTTKTFK